MAKETASEKMLRKQKEIDAKDMSAQEMYNARRTKIGALKKMLGMEDEDNFGTELSAGAEYARQKESERASKEDKPSPTIGQLRGKYSSVMKAGREAAAEERREASRMGMNNGGSVMDENKMMGKMGRGMAKAEMQKVAGTAVKKHEKSMHGMKSGGSVSKRADGCAQRGKTKGRVV